MAREHLDVADPVPKRGQLDAPDREAEEEVVAEAPRSHFAIEVAARRREDSHVDAQPLAAAHPLHLASLDGAQEPRLQREIELAELVEQERAAVGLLERAATLDEGPGERAPLVTEQRGLEQRGGDRRAVEDHERPAGPRARAVEHLGEDLFACAGLALDDDRNVARGEARA